MRTGTYATLDMGLSTPYDYSNPKNGEVESTTEFKWLPELRDYLMTVGGAREGELNASYHYEDHKFRIKYSGIRNNTVFNNLVSLANSNKWYVQRRAKAGFNSNGSHYCNNYVNWGSDEVVLFEDDYRFYKVNSTNHSNTTDNIDDGVYYLLSSKVELIYNNFATAVGGEGRCAVIFTPGTKVKGSIWVNKWYKYGDDNYQNYATDKNTNSGLDFGTSNTISKIINTDETISDGYKLEEYNIKSGLNENIDTVGKDRISGTSVNVELTKENYEKTVNFFYFKPTPKVEGSIWVNKWYKYGNGDYQKYATDKNTNSGLDFGTSNTINKTITTDETISGGYDLKQYNILSRLDENLNTNGISTVSGTSVNVELTKSNNQKTVNFFYFKPTPTVAPTGKVKIRYYIAGSSRAYSEELKENLSLGEHSYERDKSKLSEINYTYLGYDIEKRLESTKGDYTSSDAINGLAKKDTAKVTLTNTDKQYVITFVYVPNIDISIEVQHKTDKNEVIRNDNKDKQEYRLSGLAEKLSNSDRQTFNNIIQNPTLSETARLKQCVELFRGIWAPGNFTQFKSIPPVGMDNNSFNGGEYKDYRFINDTGKNIKIELKRNGIVNETKYATWTNNGNGNSLCYFPELNGIISVLNNVNPNDTIAITYYYAKPEVIVTPTPEIQVEVTKEAEWVDDDETQAEVTIQLNSSIKSNGYTYTNVPFEAKVSDIIEYDLFDYEANSVETSVGNASYDRSTKTISWNISGIYVGAKPCLKFKINLKNQYKDKSGYFNTNRIGDIVHDQQKRNGTDGDKSCVTFVLTGGKYYTNPSPWLYKNIGTVQVCYIIVGSNNYSNGPTQYTYGYNSTAPHSFDRDESILSNYEYLGYDIENGTQSEHKPYTNETIIKNLTKSDRASVTVNKYNPNYVITFVYKEKPQVTPPKRVTPTGKVRVYYWIVGSREALEYKDYYKELNTEYTFERDESKLSESEYKYIGYEKQDDGSLKYTSYDTKEKTADLKDGDNVKVTLTNEHKNCVIAFVYKPITNVDLTIEIQHKTDKGEIIPKDNQDKYVCTLSQLVNNLCYGNKNEIKNIMLEESDDATKLKKCFERFNELIDSWNPTKYVHFKSIPSASMDDSDFNGGRYKGCRFIEDKDVNIQVQLVRDGETKKTTCVSWVNYSYCFPVLNDLISALDGAQNNDTLVITFYYARPVVVTPTVGITPTKRVTPTVGITPTKRVTPTVGITPTRGVTPTGKVRVYYWIVGSREALEYKDYYKELNTEYTFERDESKLSESEYKYIGYEKQDDGSLKYTSYDTKEKTADLKDGDNVKVTLTNEHKNCVIAFVYKPITNVDLTIEIQHKTDKGEIIPKDNQDKYVCTLSQLVNNLCYGNKNEIKNIMLEESDDATKLKKCFERFNELIDRWVPSKYTQFKSIPIACMDNNDFNNGRYKGCRFINNQNRNIQVQLVRNGTTKNTKTIAWENCAASMNDDGSNLFCFPELDGLISALDGAQNNDTLVITFYYARPVVVTPCNVTVNYYLFENGQRTNKPVPSSIPINTPVPRLTVYDVEKIEFSGYEFENATMDNVDIEFKSKLFFKTIEKDTDFILYYKLAPTVTVTPSTDLSIKIRHVTPEGNEIPNTSKELKLSDVAKGLYNPKKYSDIIENTSLNDDEKFKRCFEAFDTSPDTWATARFSQFNSISDIDMKNIAGYSGYRFVKDKDINIGVSLERNGKVEKSTHTTWNEFGTSVGIGTYYFPNLEGIIDVLDGAQNGDTLVVTFTYAGPAVVTPTVKVTPTTIVTPTEAVPQYGVNLSKDAKWVDNTEDRKAIIKIEVRSWKDWDAYAVPEFKATLTDIIESYYFRLDSVTFDSNVNKEKITYDSNSGTITWPIDGLDYGERRKRWKLAIFKYYY